MLYSCSNNTFLLPENNASQNDITLDQSLFTLKEDHLFCNA